MSNFKPGDYVKYKSKGNDFVIEEVIIEKNKTYYAIVICVSNNGKLFVDWISTDSTPAIWKNSWWNSDNFTLLKSQKEILEWVINENKNMNKALKACPYCAGQGYLYTDNSKNAIRIQCHYCGYGHENSYWIKI